MEVKLVSTEKDYQAALQRLDEIFDPEPGTQDAEEAEILTLLIKNYEEKHLPIGLPEPIEYLRYYMKEHGLKANDLIKTIGSESYISQLFSRKKPLTLRIAKNLHHQLGIPAEILLQ